MESNELENNIDLCKEYTFDNFIQSQMNELVYNAAFTVAQNSASIKMFNPLFIYGGIGLGKTHLIQAIGNYIQKNSDRKIIYITGEGFMREFIEALSIDQTG